MHTRSEPRFNVQSAVRVAAADRPGDVSPALLLDVSGSGMKIISDRDWPVDSRIVVEMENHLVLARVRNGHARGSRFSVGAEKLHSVLKLMLPADAPREEWHRILLAEAADMRDQELAREVPVAADIESEEFWNEPDPPLNETLPHAATPVLSLPEEHAPEPSAVAEVAPPAISHTAEVAPAEATPLDARALETRTLEAQLVDAQTLELLKRDLQELDRKEAGTHETRPDAAHEVVTEPALEIAHELAPRTETEIAPEPVVGVEAKHAGEASRTEEEGSGEQASHFAPAMQTAAETLEEKPAHHVEGSELAAQKVERKVTPSAAASKRTEPPFAAAFPLLPAVASRPTDVRISLPVAPQFGPAYGMAPTGDMLTPISTLEEAPAISPSSKPRWIISLGVVAGLIGLVALALYFGPFRPKASSASITATTQNTETPLTISPVTEKQDTAPSNVIPSVVPPAGTPATRGASGVTTQGSPTPIRSATNSAPPAPLTKQAPSPVPSAPVATAASVAPRAGARRATLKASGMNWISTCSDGKPDFAGLLNAGNTRDIDFQHTAVVRVGNAGAAELYVDGKSMGPLGAAGSVRIVEITASGMRTLPANLSPAAECKAQP